MADVKLQSIVEALLFVSDRPLSLREMQDVLKDAKDGIALEEIREVIAELKALYESSARSFQIHEVATGFQIKTLPPFAPFIAKLLKDELRERLSLPTLETLAIIAYKQPVIRADVEAIRGVNIDGIVKTLLDKDLIKIVGKKDIPGKPSLLGTTKRFLTHFGLKNLEDLPNMEEFKEALVAREAQLELHKAAAGTEEASPAQMELAQEQTVREEQAVSAEADQESENKE